jgi:ATP-dependent DNA helicase RecG
MSTSIKQEADMHISELYPDVIGEDLNYEFKAALSEDNPIKWAKTIVAYANSDGGTIFVGVNDSGEAFGLSLQEIDRIKNQIALENERHIIPKVKITYLLRNIDDKMGAFVLAVKVSPSESLVRYRSGDYNEQVFIRQDGSTTPAKAEDIIALSGRKKGIDNETTDIRYSEKNWSLYLELCRNYRRDNSVPSLKELQSMELVSPDGYAKSGFMMFADDYKGDDTLICCRLWTGKDKLGSTLDKARFKGPIPKVFEDALTFIERNTKTGWRKTETGGREEIRSYPSIAVREGAINAIAHRDYSIFGTQIDIDIYSNRMEIMSPGSWLLPVPYEQYESDSIPSARRNSIIAAALDTASLMERSGTGIRTIMNSYKDQPSEKQPCLMIYPGFINLRLFDNLNAEDPLHTLNDTEKILRLLEDGPKHARDLQKVTKYTSRQRFLVEIMNPLLADGRVVREGNIKSPQAFFRLTEKS